MRFLTPVRGLQLSPNKNETRQSPKRNIDNELVARKMKAANYGKWYLQPNDYNRKIEVLNKKINATIENSIV